MCCWRKDGLLAPRWWRSGEAAGAHGPGAGAAETNAGERLRTQRRDPVAQLSVAAVARSGEPDRYVAALLAAPRLRETLLALAALSAELARIPLRVREPAMGDIRLQWWRDALEHPSAERTGNPVADAVRAAALEHAIPGTRFATLIDGHARLLQRGAPLDATDLDRMLWETEGILFALAAHVAGVPATPELESGCHAAGRAYGVVRLLLGLPRRLALGEVPLPAAQLEAAGLGADDLLAGVADARIERLLALCSAEARRGLAIAGQFAAGLARGRRVAFLPLALVQSYLRALARSGQALLRRETDIAPLTRVYRIGAAHLTGRWPGTSGRAD
jgi:phytoene synthase